MPWLEVLAPQTPVDVVDEPEQIAVLQADPRQGEPLDLEPVPQPQLEPEPPAPITSAARWSPAEEAELAKGMLLVVLGSAGG
jgi:hypothetical protein